MREYRFRAWDKIHKCYLPIDSCGCFVWGALQCGIPADRKADSGVGLVFPSQPDKDPDYFGSMCSLFCGDDLVLEQWTGLKDKNGQDVYEGDIVNTRIYAGEVRALEIKAYKGGFIIGFEDEDADYFYLGEFPGSFEVIGTINDKEAKQ